MEKTFDETKWKKFLWKIGWLKLNDVWDPKEAQQTLRWLKNSYAKGDAALYHQRPNLGLPEICPVPLPTRLLDLGPPLQFTKGSRCSGDHDKHRRPRTLCDTESQMGQ